MSKDKPKPSKETKPETVHTFSNGNKCGIAIKADEKSLVVTIRYGHGCEDIGFFGIPAKPDPSGTKGGGTGGPPYC